MSCVVLLPVDDTASITKEPNSVLSGTLQEPHKHASPLHFPVQASSAPERTNKKMETNRQSGSDVSGEQSPQRQFQGEFLLRLKRKDVVERC